MISGIQSVLKELNNLIKKDDILKTLEFTISSIKNQVIPGLDTVLSAKNIDSTDLNSFGKMCGISGGGKATVTNIRKFFAEISGSLDTLHTQADRLLPNVITDKSVSARDASIIKMVSDITSMSAFILDYMFIGLSGGKTGLPKIHVERVKRGCTDFAFLYKAYSNGKFEKMLKDLPGVSTEMLDLNNENKSMLDILIAKTGKIINLPAMSGFVGNPIYHIRMWIADHEHAKYEAMVEKKKLLDLKVMSLNLDRKEDGVDKNKIDKQIEFYQDKIADLEMQIDKYEND